MNNQLQLPLSPIPPIVATPSQLALLVSEEPFDGSYTFIHNIELQNSEFVDTSSRVMICETLYIKSANSTAMDKQVFFRDRSQGRCNYDKILFAIDIFAPAGGNVVVFLLGRGQCENFFKGCNKLRDSGELGECYCLGIHYSIRKYSHLMFVFSLYDAGPGGMFVVENPPVINAHFGKSRLPVLSIPSSIIPVKLDNCRIPERDVDESTSSQHAFLFENCQVSLSSIHAMDVNCGGSLCDANRCYVNGRLSTSCSCFTINKRDADVVLLLTLRVVTRSNRTLIVHDFTSKKFTKFFMKGQQLKSGLRAAHFNQSGRRTRVELRHKVVAVLDFVNQGGLLAAPAAADADACNARKGWTVHGWSRRGEVVDQGVDQPAGPTLRNEGPRLVEATDLTYHITHITPTTPSALGDLSGMLFDCNAFLETAAAPDEEGGAGGEGGAAAASSAGGAAGGAAAAAAGGGVS